MSLAAMTPSVLFFLPYTSSSKVVTAGLAAKYSPALSALVLCSGEACVEACNSTARDLLASEAPVAVRPSQ